MEHKSEMEGRGMSGLLYFVLGAAAGAGLAILFAPAEGKVTRAEMSRWLKQKREQGRQAWAQRKDHHKELAGV